MAEENDQVVVHADEQTDGDANQRAIEAQQRAAEAEKKAAAADALAAAFAKRIEQDAAGSPEGAQASPLGGSVGLGVDIVEIDRMARVLERTPRFRERVYSEDERAYCDKMARPAVHYATRFAAKEAVLKALGTGFSEGIAPSDVEVQRTSMGRPVAVLHRKAAEVAKELGVKEIPISLSYTHNEAVACAMAITFDSVKVAEQRVNPMDELAKQFKDARAMLDELPAQEGMPVAAKEDTEPELPFEEEPPVQADSTPEEDGAESAPTPEETTEE